MERLQENYRQFDYNRFVYQEAKPAPTNTPEGVEASKEKTDKAPSGPEQTESIDTRVQAFDAKTDAQANTVGVDPSKLDDLQNAHKSALENTKGKRDLAANGMDEKLDSVTKTFEQKVANFIDKAKKEKPAEPAPAAKKEDKAESAPSPDEVLPPSALLGLKDVPTDTPAKFNEALISNFKNASEGLIKYLKDNKQQVLTKSTPREGDKSNEYLTTYSKMIDDCIQQIEKNTATMIKTLESAKDQPIEKQKEAVKKATITIGTSSANLFPAEYIGVMQSFIPYDLGPAFAEIDTHINDNVWEKAQKSAEKTPTLEKTERQIILDKVIEKAQLRITEIQSSGLTMEDTKNAFIELINSLSENRAKEIIDGINKGTIDDLVQNKEEISKMKELRQKYLNKHKKEVTNNFQEAKEKGPNDPRNALTTILFRQGKFKEWLAPEMGIDKGVDKDTFKAKLEEKFPGKIDACLKDPESPLVKGLTEKGDQYQLTAEDAKAIDKVFSEGLEDVDKAEVALINGLEISDGKDKKTFAEVFGKDFATVLSMKYKITEGAGGNIITINDKPYAKFEDIINSTDPQIFPAEMGNKYKALFPKRDSVAAGYNDAYGTGLNEQPKEMKPEEREAKIKELSEMGTKEAITAARMAQVEKALLSPEGVAGLKGMKPMELIATIMQLWSVAKKAFESGDFSTLTDMMGDLNSGKNPMESMKEAENMYKQKIEGINDPNQLADLYMDPNGTKVTEMFGEGARYKNMMKQAIEGKMESALNVDITKMEKEAEGGTRIFAKKGGRNFEITISQDNKMKVEEVETGDYDKRIAQLQDEISDLGATNPERKKELRQEIARLEDKNGKEDRADINVGDAPFQGLTGTNSMAERFQKVLKGETTVEPAPAQTQVAENNPPPVDNKDKKNPANKGKGKKTKKT